MTFYIRTISDLASLAQRRAGQPRHGRLVLDVAGLPEHDAKAWAAKLSRDYFSCGCEVGSVALLLALAAYVTTVAVTSGGFASATWRDLGLGIAIGFAAAGIGKLAGLANARRRLRGTIGVLATRLAELGDGVA